EFDEFDDEFDFTDRASGDDLEYGEGRVGSERNGQGGNGPGRDGSGRDGSGRDGRGRGEADIAELRRKLRRHPRHGCPEREQHARYAERYFRQQQEASELDRQIGSRSHVIARTFAKVCAVLDQLGYLDGDTVTPDGKRLAGLYSELDLLAAECLRKGFWEG